MKLQAIVTACCKVLGLLLIYRCVATVAEHGPYFFLLMQPGSEGYLVFYALAPIGLFVAAVYVIRHAQQIACHLVGELGEESVRFVDEREFWVHLSYVLLALYFILGALARIAAALVGLLYGLFDLPNGFLVQQLSSGVGGAVLLVAALILFRRSSPRLKGHMSASTTADQQ